MQKLIGKNLVHYSSVGEQNKQTVLFLPGWMNSAASWQPLCSKLKNTYHCVVIDLPGFGSTIADFSKPWDVEDYSEFVTQFLAKTKIQPDIVIAHSFGGKIAVQIANNYKLKRLVLIAPSIAFEQKLLIKIKNFVFKILKIPILLLGEKNKNKIASLFGSDDYKNAGKLLPTFQKIVNRKMIDETSKVKTKTLIIWGDKDTQIPVSTSKNIYKLIEKSKIRIVWGGGHELHLKNIDKLIGVLREEGL